MSWPGCLFDWFARMTDAGRDGPLECGLGKGVGLALRAEEGEVRGGESKSGRNSSLIAGMGDRNCRPFPFTASAADAVDPLWWAKKPGRAATVRSSD